MESMHNNPDPASAWAPYDSDPVPYRDTGHDKFMKNMFDFLIPNEKKPLKVVSNPY